MGGDGGSIPQRSELVKTAKAAEKKDAQLERKQKWETCQASTNQLKDPIVCDVAGNLYNKLDVLQMMATKTLPEKFDYIKKLKDLYPVQFYFPGGAKTSAAESTQGAVCPVSSTDCNGTNVFYAMKGCGCVIADRATSQMKTEELLGPCIFCLSPAPTPAPTKRSERYIKLNPSEDEQKTAIEEFKIQRAAEDAKRRKQKKDGKKNKTAIGNGNAEAQHVVAAKRKAPAPAPTVNAKVARLVEQATKNIAAPSHGGTEVWNRLFVTKEERERELKNNNPLCRAIQRPSYK